MLARGQIGEGNYVSFLERGPIAFVQAVGIKQALAGIVTGTLHLPALMPATVKPSAIQDYMTGLSCLRTNDRVDEAVARMERAVTADPDSPLTALRAMPVSIWVAVTSTPGNTAPV